MSRNYKRKTNRTYLAKPEPAVSNQPLPMGRAAGLLKWMAERPKLLGWLELVACILLLMLAFKGFLDGGVWLPFGFGLLSLRFFYGYVQHNLGVQFGKVAVPLNLALLIGALICVVIGLSTESSIL